MVEIKFRRLEKWFSKQEMVWKWRKCKRKWQWRKKREWRRSKKKKKDNEDNQKRAKISATSSFKCHMSCWVNSCLTELTRSL